MGLNTVAMASIAGASRIILVGAPAFGLELEREFGVDEVVDITGKSSEESIGEVFGLTRRGVDVTIEAIGSPRAIVEGLRMTRDGGTYAVVGQYTEKRRDLYQSPLS